jgi:probable rRNA maturation factor
LEMPQKIYSKVQFHFLVNSFSLRDRTQLKAYIETIFKKEGYPLASLTFIFCSDKYLRSINKTFLSHNYETDIITFNLSESDKIVGEVYISIDRVRDNARFYGKTLREELHRVIFHGVFHLCGYKDKAFAEQKEMRSKENKALSEYL